MYLVGVVMPAEHALRCGAYDELMDDPSYSLTRSANFNNLLQRGLGSKYKI